MFKAGDMIEMLETCGKAKKGDICKLVCLNCNDDQILFANELCSCQEKWKLVNSNQAKFQIGDEVIYSPKFVQAKIWKVGEAIDGFYYWLVGESDFFCEESLVRVSQSKYEKLKRRINNLNNGWDKEANEILAEMNTKYNITIPTENYSNRPTVIRISDYGEQNDGIVLARFEFNSQCSKMIAFKNALLWLLDKSEINDCKDSRINKIKELNSQISKLQEEIKNESKY